MNYKTGVTCVFHGHKLHIVVNLLDTQTEYLPIQRTLYFVRECHFNAPRLYLNICHLSVFVTLPMFCKGGGLQ